MALQVLIERFYHNLWNQADESVAYAILHPEFSFRGSLGDEKRGPDGFLEYMRAIHAALGGYTCAIQDVIEGDGRVAARMLFSGTHRGEFLGVPATGKQIQWAGAAFFSTENEKITNLWVLGDIDALKEQLRPHS